jgi:hypothetical protein
MDERMLVDNLRTIELEAVGVVLRGGAHRMTSTLIEAGKTRQSAAKRGFPPMPCRARFLTAE